LGVRIAPYINGRLFDRSIDMWKANDYEAEKAAAKYHWNKLNSTAEDIFLYEESFGAIDSDLVVMCPDTDYWQNKMVSVIEEMVDTYKTDGVYIDQVSIARPIPCYDRTHNHTVGGGNFWIAGYNKML
jgi:uncharacterized lipoprotein YddW (UPF0748 family)